MLILILMILFLTVSTLLIGFQSALIATILLCMLEALVEAIKLKSKGEYTKALYHMSWAIMLAIMVNILLWL